jgi:hypothetical protein
MLLSVVFRSKPDQEAIIDVAAHVKVEMHNLSLLVTRSLEVVFSV